VVLVAGGSVGLVELEVSAIEEFFLVGIGLEVPIDSMGDNDSDSVVNLAVGGFVGLVEVSSIGGNFPVSIGLLEAVSSIYEVGTNEL
jgi:hypothetical protein